MTPAPDMPLLPEALEKLAGDIDHKAFLCHTHDDLGKGRERGLLDAAKIIRERIAELKQAGLVAGAEQVRAPMDAFANARMWAIEALEGKPESGDVEMFVDLAMLRVLADAFETVEGAKAAGVLSGTLANGDTFGDEDDV